MRQGIIVTKHNTNEYPDAAIVLQKAFKTDPVHNWFFQRDYDFYSEMFFNCIVNQLGISKNKGIVRTVVDDDNKIRVSSLWFDNNQPQWYEYFGLLPLTIRYPSAFYRLMYIDSVMEPIHKKIMGNRPHWYLILIGTDPEYEGKGYGSQLMKEQLEIIDKEGKETYLESSKEENIPFYEKFGFKLIEKIQKGSMPPLFAMKRDPIKEDKQEKIEKEEINNEEKNEIHKNSSMDIKEEKQEEKEEEKEKEY